MQTGPKPTPFVRLERQVRWLHLTSVVLVVIVAFAPASVFVVVELGHLRENTVRYANRLAVLITSEVERQGAPLERVRALLSRDAVTAGVSSLVLLDDRGQTVLRVGRRDGFGVGQVRVALPGVADPVRELVVDPDEWLLIRQAARVLVIHVLVGVFLAVIVYRLPLRSLRHALREVEATHNQLLHSAKLGTIGETYAGLAHEINNPLGIILSRVRLMLGAARERGANADLIRDLEMIDRHGTRIADIVRSLLAFSRKTRFEPAETDVNRVVRDAVALVGGPFARHQIQIQTVLDPALPRVLGSPDHLQQVFVNLLNNARDAMPGGGAITLRTYRRNGAVVAEVEDGGHGVAPEIRDRIFEPFFTTKQTGHGTGLGLSVSYGIVSAHGGTIEVESPLGRGACFRLTLPVGGPRA
jgi:signal transduction histidine kinase